jgi:hypothetical protein
MIEEIPVPSIPNPWREIWLHPRSTIRAILNYNHTEACEPLAMVMGVFWLFWIWIAGVAIGLTTLGGSITIIFMTLLGGSFLGFFVVRWLASAITGFGRSVGHEVDKGVIYTALTWSAIPLTVAIPLQILFLLFASLSWSASDFITSAVIGFGGTLLKIGVWILGAWHLGLAVAMVAEVARVRVWLAALWVIIFPAFLAMLVFGAIFLCFFMDLLMMSRNL